MLHRRHALDMLHHLKNVPGNSPTIREKVIKAITLIDRDIVKEVF